MSEAVVSLPMDVKAALRIVEDAEVDDGLRASTAGAIMHVISAGNSIPGVRGVLQRVGDALLLRLVLRQLKEKAPEGFERHREHYPELLEPLDEQLEVAEAFLGKERLSVLEKQAEGLPEVSHQGHAAKDCVSDTESANWLYDAVQEALIEELEFDEDDVAREMKSADRILRALDTRLPA